MYELPGAATVADALQWSAEVPEQRVLELLPILSATNVIPGVARKQRLIEQVGGRFPELQALEPPTADIVEFPVCEHDATPVIEDRGRDVQVFSEMPVETRAAERSEAVEPARQRGFEAPTATADWLKVVGAQESSQ